MTSPTVPTRADRIWADFTSLRSRFSFRFSASGQSAAALVADGRGAAYIEYWTFGDSPGCQPLLGTWSPATTIEQEGVPGEAIPFDDGRVLYMRRRNDAHELVVTRSDGGLGVLGVLHHPEVVILASHSSGRTLLAGRDSDGSADLWCLDDFVNRPHKVARVQSPHFMGGGWLDDEGRHYAMNVKCEGTVKPVLIDTFNGEVASIVDLPPGVNCHVLTTSTATGRALVACDAGGSWEFALLHALTEKDIRPAASLNCIDGEVNPLTFDPLGEHILVHVRKGLSTRLMTYSPSDDTLQRLTTPDGSVSGPATWIEEAGEQRIRCLFVSASMPFRVLTMETADLRSAPPKWRMQDDGTLGNSSDRWADAHIEEFPGEDGPIEAVVCGHLGWREARHVVVALHGGPERAWTMKFDQFFQYLAHHGITVIAPNPRGSIGYGTPFQRAIRSSWAGPDLADIRSLARHVREQRKGDDHRLLLFGQSYGAYLALIAAAADADAWSRVVAVAPFLSGVRLREEASSEIRGLIARLGGDHEIDDDFGPRDVIRLAARIKADLMVVHGDEDPVIPASQSRTLRDHMIRLTDRKGKFRYCEVAGGHHGPLEGSEALHMEVAEFLSGGTQNDRLGRSEDDWIGGG